MGLRDLRLLIWRVEVQGLGFRDLGVLGLRFGTSLQSCTTHVLYFYLFEGKGGRLLQVEFP